MCDVVRFFEDMPRASLSDRQRLALMDIAKLRLLAPGDITRLLAALDAMTETKSDCG